MKRLILVVPLIAVGLLVLSACQGAAGPAGKQGAPGPQGLVGPTGPAGSPGASGASAQDVTKLIDEKFSKVDRNLPLWSIQDGTASKMVELTIYFNNMWFGAQAGNWDLARFEIYRSDEAVKAIAVTRPARTAVLKPWADSSLGALTKAVEAKNLGDFEKAYDNSIAGCNGCHVGSEGGPLKSMKAFKITRPTTPLFSNIDYKGIP